jgi:thiol-disulfide isomerase/thioredoxin
LGTAGRIQPHTHFESTDDVGQLPIESGADGRLTLPAARVFVPPFRFAEDASAPLYVLHEPRGLAAIDEVRRSEFGRPGDAVREIRLLPACRVNGTVTSVGLPDSGRSIAKTTALVFPPGRFDRRSITSGFNGPRFEFLLPPGEHAITVHAADSPFVIRHLRIEPGRREVNLHLDVPPGEVAQRLGRAAPELRDIKGWKNGAPVKLGDLRGKVVLLDFWGHWCGPCITAMPALMKLHDTFKDRGLVVVAVHDDSADSIEDVDRRLERVRTEVWGGRDLPFLVALDGGGPDPVPRLEHDPRRRHHRGLRHHQVPHHPRHRPRRHAPARDRRYVRRRGFRDRTAARAKLSGCPEEVRPRAGHARRTGAPKATAAHDLRGGRSRARLARSPAAPPTIIRLSRSLPARRI